MQKTEDYILQMCVFGRMSSCCQEKRSKHRMVLDKRSKKKKCVEVSPNIAIYCAKIWQITEKYKISYHISTKCSFRGVKP